MGCNEESDEEGAGPTGRFSLASGDVCAGAAGSGLSPFSEPAIGLGVSETGLGRLSDRSVLNVRR